jgi:signal transduction histidine kinase
MRPPDQEHLDREAWQVVHTLASALKSAEHFLELAIAHVDPSGEHQKITFEPEYFRSSLERPMATLRSAMARIIAEFESKQQDATIQKGLWAETLSGYEKLEADLKDPLTIALPEACHKDTATLISCVDGLRASRPNIKNELLKNVHRATLDVQRVACMHNLELVLNQTERLRGDALHLLAWKALLLEPAKPRTVCELNSIVRNVLRHNRSYAKRRRIRFDPHYGAKSLIRVVEEEISLAVECIINNAIKYSHEMDAPEEAWISVVTKAQPLSGECLVAVESWGWPILPEELVNGRIFDFGYRGQHVRTIVADGTGVGLSKAKLIAQKYVGRILVQSIPSRNQELPDYEHDHFKTTVTLTLPLHRS